MKAVVNNTTILAIQTNTHSWNPTDPFGYIIPRVLGDWTNISGNYQYNIYYTTDDGQEGFWQNYGPAGGSFNPIADGVNIIRDIPGNYFIRQSPIFDGTVNVKWFGAIGDGLNDDTEAIQSALNFISDTGNYFTRFSDSITPGGGTIFIPKGIYVITETLLVGYNCKILGVSNRSLKSLDFYEGTGGSVIKCNFDDQNIWAISSATRLGNWFNPSLPPAPNYPYPWGLTPGEMLPFDKGLSAKPINLVTNSFDRFSWEMGIWIEGIIIDGMIRDEDGLVIANAFGGIRLANAMNSTIRNVSVINAKIGFMLNTSWYGTIEDCFVNALWYGAVIIECNIAAINCCSFRGSVEDDGINKTDPEHPFFNYIPLISEEESPYFIYNEHSFSSWGLNDNVKYGKTGIYAFGTELSIINTGVEQFTIGMTLLNCSGATIESGYTEANLYYGVVSGINWDTDKNSNQLIVNGFFNYNSDYAFFFGNNTMAMLNSVMQLPVNNPISDGHIVYEFVGQLFETSINTGRNITFSNTIYYKRKYIPDIFFSNEGVNGQNFGEVYVNPDEGSDDNYGFNQNDSLRTFDAALIRVQNQSTINPVKTIFVKAAPEVIEGGNLQAGAAIKDLSVKSLDNIDVLITTYGKNFEVYPPSYKGRIFFEGNASSNPEIGQIELLNNVNLYFKDVYLVCNTPTSPPSGNANLTMFGLKNSFGKITFNSNRIIFSFPYDIDLNSPYNLIKANLDSLSMVSPISFIEVKFLNIGINGGALSPLQTGSPTLGVDCVQIASSRNGGGWQDAIIIRNNF